MDKQEFSLEKLEKINFIWIKFPSIRWILRRQMKGFSCRGQKKKRCTMGHNGRSTNLYVYTHTQTYTHTTHTHSFTCPPSTGSVRDSPFFFLFFVSESEETSVSVSTSSLLVGVCVCVCRRTQPHTLTHTHRVRAQTHKHLHPPTHRHTHAAFCCCDGSELSKHPRFHSLSLTKAAWLSLSTQVHRDCCLPFLSFLSSSSPLSPFVSFDLFLFIFAQPPFPLFFLVLSSFLCFFSFLFSSSFSSFLSSFLHPPLPLSFSPL